MGANAPPPLHLKIVTFYVFAHNILFFSFFPSPQEVGQNPPPGINWNDVPALDTSNYVYKAFPVYRRYIKHFTAKPRWLCAYYILEWMRLYMSTAPVYGCHISILLWIYVCKIIAFVNFQKIKAIFIYIFFLKWLLLSATCDTWNKANIVIIIFVITCMYYCTSNYVRNWQIGVFVRPNQLPDGVLRSSVDRHRQWRDCLRTAVRKWVEP